MRLRSSTAELEEAGLETEGMAETTATLRKELLALAGIDIMLDGDTLKSTYQIMTELAAVWDKMTDVESAAVLELVAGKRMANTAASIIQNIEDAGKAYEVSQNAAGSAMAENEKYLESIQGHWDKFNATYESLSQNLIDSDTVKAGIDLLTGVLDLIDKGADALSEWPIIITGITTAISVFSKKVPNLSNALQLIEMAPDKITGKNKLQLGSFWQGLVSKKSGIDLDAIELPIDDVELTKVGDAFNYLNKAAATGKLTLEELQGVAQAKLQFFDPSVYEYYNAQLLANNGNMQQLIVTKEGYIVVTKQDTAATLADAAAKDVAAKKTAMFNAVLKQVAIFAVVALVQSLVQAFDDYIHRVEIAREEMQGLHSDFKESQSTLDGYYDRLGDIKERLNEINQLGGLTLSDAKEKKLLEDESAELKRQIKLEETIAKLKKKQAVAAAEYSYNNERYSNSGYQLPTQYTISVPGQGMQTVTGTAGSTLSENLINQTKRMLELQAEAEELTAGFTEGKIDNTAYVTRMEKNDEQLEAVTTAVIQNIETLETYKEVLGEEHDIVKNEINPALIEHYKLTDPNYVFNGVVDVLSGAKFDKLTEELTKVKNSGEKLTGDSAKKIAETFPYFEELESHLETEGISWEEFANIINTTDYSQGIRFVKELEEAYELPKLKEQLTKITEAFDKLNAAADEYAETGGISVSTFEELLNLGPEYLDLLYDENGQLSLNKERIQEVTSAYIDQIAHKQAIALVDTVSSLKTEEEQMEALSLTVKEATGNLRGFAKAYAIMAHVRPDNPISQEVLDEILDRQDAIFAAADAAKVGLAQTYGGTADAFSKARAALEHELDMGRISQAKFWDELEKLRDRYFVKGSNEWTEYYREIEKGRDELQEKLLKLEGEMAIKAIDKKIDAKKKELEQLEEEYEKEDKLFELQKARDRYEAAKRNLNTRLYTEDKGWVWVADPKELQDSREELEKLEKEQAREEAKKAIEDEIEALEDLKDKYQEAMDQIGMDLQEHADMLEWLEQFEEMTYEELAAHVEAYADKVVAEYERIARAKREAAEAGEDGSTGGGTLGKTKAPDNGANIVSAASADLGAGRASLSSGGNTVTSASADLGAGKASLSGPSSSGTFSSMLTKTTTTTTTTTKKSSLHTPISQLITGKKASGASYVAKDGTYLVDEVGPELIARHNEAGRLTHLELGDTVFPADMTQRLWDLAATGAFALASASRIPVRTNLHEGAFAAQQSVSSSNDIVLTGCSFNLQNVTDVDSFFGELNRIANRHRRK